MSDRSPGRPQPGSWTPPPADATRDIRLPPLPDRPAPGVRPEWAPYVPAAEQAPAAAPPQDSSGPQPTAATDRVEAQPAAEPSQEHAEQPRRPHDVPTDRLPPRNEQARSRTLAFEPPPPVQLLKVSVGARPRRGRWLWAVAILLPVLVILGSGIWLFVLFYGG